MKSRTLGAVFSCALAIASTTTYAAIVNVNFEAQNFIGNLGATAPQDPVTGSFSIQHDGAADFTGTAINPTLVSVDLTINGFVYDLGNTALNLNFLLSNGLVAYFFVGGTLNDFNVVSGNTNDFFLELFDDPNVGMSYMVYSVEGIPDFFESENTLTDPTNVIFNSTVVPVPPAVWLFFSGLFGMIGLVRRKKS